MGFKLYSIKQKYELMQFMFDVKSFVIGRTDFDTLITRGVTLSIAMARVNNNCNGRYSNLKDAYKRVWRLLGLDIYKI